MKPYRSCVAFFCSIDDENFKENPVIIIKNPVHLESPKLNDMGNLKKLSKADLRSVYGRKPRKYW